MIVRFIYQFQRSLLKFNLLTIFYDTLNEKIIKYRYMN